MAALPLTPGSVHFWQDKDTTWSLNLELSSSQARKIIHGLHDLDPSITMLPLGEAYVVMETQMYHTPTTRPDWLVYRASLQWQMAQQLPSYFPRLLGRLSEAQLTELYLLLLGAVIGKPCLQGENHGRLVGVSMVEGVAHTLFQPDSGPEIRERFYHENSLNPHGLSFTRQHIRQGLNANFCGDKDAQDMVLYLYRALDLTVLELDSSFRIGLHHCIPMGPDSQETVDDVRDTSSFDESETRA